MNIHGRGSRGFVVAALLALGLAVNAAGQSADMWASVMQLAPGTEIRAGLSSGRTAGGAVQSTTADSVVIQSGAGREKLLRAEIKRVQVKGKGRRGRNVLIGLAIGAGGGLAIGAAVDSHDKGSNFNFIPNAGKAIFTPLGAIIGAIVGVAIPAGAWREVYRAP